MTDKRPVRMCDSCGQVDDHPRHVYALADGDGVTKPEVAAAALKAASPEDFEAIVAQVQDGSTLMKHMDCCRNDGCPDGSCNVVTAGAENKTGAALLKHLTSRDTSQDADKIGGVVGVRNDDTPDDVSSFPESTPGAASLNDPANETDTDGGK